MPILDNFSAEKRYQQQLIEWLRGKAQESIALLKRERGFNEIQRAIDYVNGEQVTVKSKALSKLYDNKLRKIVLETVSALTDVRPIWNYETNDTKFDQQAGILNKLARGWWKNSAADRRLQSILTFACVGGSGYGYLQWNADLDDFELIALDPRDVIPIDPVFTDSIQDWTGLIIRRKMSVEEFKARWPAKAYMAERAASGDWFGIDVGRLGKATDYIRTALDVIRGGTATKSKGLGVDVMTVFMKDNSINTGTEPQVMGPEGANWRYVVYPLGSVHPQRSDGPPVSREEAKLYPNGRMVICTGTDVLEDQPNPYWHGKFPVVKFTLDPLPWSLLGASMVSDAIPLQEALNESLRGWDDAVGQWVRRGVIGDRNSVSKANLDAVDTRRGGMKFHVNAQLGEGVKIIDGPSLPPSYLAFPEFIKGELDENTGIRGLQELSQLKQMPSADTIEQYKEALSPLLKLRSRCIEMGLSELADMLKSGFFQYYTAPRRMQILGQAGLALEDFDYDPGTLVPAGEGQVMDRLKKHHRNFKFSIAPNSFLNVSHTMLRLMMLQLFQRNGVDIWSLWKAMDFVDIGEQPGENIADRLIWARKQGLQPGPTPELVQAQLEAAVAAAEAQKAQAMMAMQQMQAQAAGGVGPVDSGGGGGQASAQPQQVRTDGVGPQGGRPPSAQGQPALVQRDGGARTVLSESGR